MKLLPLYVFGLLNLLWVAGCGYTSVGDDPKNSYQWRSLYREDVRTVAVPIFQNKDFRRGVEFSLHRLLVPFAPLVHHPLAKEA